MTKPKLEKSVASRELKKIRSKEGRITPNRIIEIARDPKNPLHSWFTWDEAKAAQKCRIDEARALLAWVETKIVVEDREFKVPEYVRDPSVTSKEQGFRATEKIRDDPEDARAVIVEEFIKAGSHLRRARNLAQVLGKARDVESVISRVDALRATFLNEAGTA